MDWILRYIKTYLYLLHDVLPSKLLFPLQELNKRQTQIEYAHRMLLRHHDSTLDIENKHLNAIHHLRDEQMRKQHHTELANQKEYTARAERELKNKHGLEVKQQPKNLKVGGPRTSKSMVCFTWDRVQTTCVLRNLMLCSPVYIVVVLFALMLLCVHVHHIDFYWTYYTFLSLL